MNLIMIFIMNHKTPTVTIAGTLPFIKGDSDFSHKNRGIGYRRGVTYFFFLSGFSSQTLTIHRTAGEGKGPSFIPLYHFHPPTNVETFICNFAFEMTIRYF